MPMQIILILFVVVTLCVLQGYLYAKKWLHHLSVDLAFEKNGVFEGDQIQLKEIIRNQKWMPLLWLSIKFQVSKNLLFLDQTSSQTSDDYYRYDLFSVLFYQKIIKTLPIRCSKRGFYVIKDLQLFSGDLLGFNKLVHNTTSLTYLYVYPRLLSIDELITPFQKMMGEILARRFIIEDPFEFRGIREYSSFDSLKTVNWKATAKTGHLKVNVHDYTASQEIMILLNLQQESLWDLDKLQEESIRIAASLATYYMDEGIPVGFMTNGLDLSTKEEIRILPGSHAEHMQTFYEYVARIDTQLPIRDFSEILKEEIPLQSTEPLWVLVSHYHQSDLEEQVISARSKGFIVQWIIPKMPDTQVILEHIQDAELWEVSEYGNSY
jgi:uncharacterized protein (DUF58 family)